MKKCSTCGNELHENAVICPSCGCPQDGYMVPKYKDSGNILWFIIGFCSSWLGLILWLIWKDTTPKRAKMCLKGFLCGLILPVVILIIGIVYVQVNKTSLDVDIREGNKRYESEEIIDELNEKITEIKYLSIHSVNITEEQYTKISNRLNPALIRAVENDIPDGSPKEKILKCAEYSELDTEQALNYFGFTLK